MHCTLAGHKEGAAPQGAYHVLMGEREALPTTQTSAGAPGTTQGRMWHKHTWALGRNYTEMLRISHRREGLKAGEPLRSAGEGLSPEPHKPASGWNALIGLLYLLAQSFQLLDSCPVPTFLNRE